MEQTRTPSLLSKVSLWTIVIMGVTDSWIFSAHVVMGILSESKSSITLLVPGFLGLCNAIVFGPVSSPSRFNVYDHLLMGDSGTRSCSIGFRRRNESPPPLRLRSSGQRQ